jgi:hypothetical protein
MRIMELGSQIRKSARRHAWRLAVWGMMAMVMTLTASKSSAAPEAKVLLVASSPDNYVAQGLNALGVTHERARARDYRNRSPFDYDVLIWGMDEDRAILDTDPEAIRAFVEGGGILLGMRCSSDDAWLPSPVKRDKAYQFGKILQPDHPIFNTPHRMDQKAMLEVHSGSIYRAFFDLGKGWTPLVSTGAEQHWDKVEALSKGEHYGIVELALGKGRILLVQMIPEYHWFSDTKGDRSSAGARFFENLVQYALAKSPRQAASRPPRKRPERFYTDLTEALALPRRGDGVPVDDGKWRFTSSGPYSMKTDRRGVITFTHADTPSQAGSFAQVTRTIPVVTSDAPVTLRWYESDTYCGGREIVLGGAKHGQTALENYKREMRFAQVLVNGEKVWEEDVLGRNPQPARTRFRTADITEIVRKAGGRCEVTLRVEDRQGSGEHPFAIDVFFATVDVITDLRRAPAAALLKPAGFEPGDEGTLVLRAGSGAAQTTHSGNAGRFAIAFSLRDEHTGRSRVRVLAGRQEVARWTLTADDHRLYWAVTPLVRLTPGTPLRIEATAVGDEAVEIREVAVIPERLLAKPVVAAAPPADGGAGAKRVRFQVTVPETAGIARTGEVAAQGIPFPVHCLPRPDQVRVLGSDGKALPVQTRTIAPWPNGTTKMLLVAFPATVPAGGNSVYTIEAGEGVRPVPVPDGLKVSEADGLLTIDTGAMVATVSMKHGRIVEEVRRGSTVVKPASEVWDFALEDETGRVVRTRDAIIKETEIVERGPVRALIVRKGSFTDAKGTLVDFRIHLEATAGSDALRVLTHIINREETPEVYLKRWSMDLRRAGAATGKVWLSPEETRAANPGAVLYQHREDTVTWTGADGARSRVKGKSPGHVRLPGVALGTRWFWERFPQAIRFDTEGVRLDFIPEAFDEGDLPNQWLARLREMTDRFTVGGVGYPQSPGKMGLFRLAQGEALGQEILLVMDGRGADATDASLFAPLGAPLRAVPDPEYTASTGAFGEFHPSDPVRYARYEQSVERTYKGILAQRASRREYGFENFGDSTFEWGYGPSYTYWSNSEYDHHNGYALQYLRSADPRWWDLCEQTARHTRDVSQIHHAAPGNTQLGGPRHHNATSLWMPQHPEQFWIADHTLRGAHPGHAWAEGMIAYWFLTGDPWTKECVDLLANWYCEVVERNQYGAGGQERGPGWTLIAISALTRATGGERIRNAGWIVANWLLDWQDPIRGVVSVPISEQPSYEGGSTFMHGIVGRGLGRWYDVTGDPRVKDAAIGIAEWITTEPMGEPGTFWYKQSPQNSKRYSADGQCISALTYGYKLSGDPWFAEVSKALLSRTGADRRSISWYPQALGHLASILPPISIQVPASSPAAGETAEVKVALRAPKGKALKGHVALEAGGGAVVEPATQPVNAPGGEIVEATFRLTLPKSLPAGPAIFPLRATCRGAGKPMEVTTEIRAADMPLKGAIVVQAEAFVAQEGGAVQIRDDKAGASGRSFSHWDSAGHWLRWRVRVPEAGTYRLILRYCTKQDTQREVRVDSEAPLKQTLRNSGGFSSVTSSDWAHHVVTGADGKPHLFRLSAGEHTITLTNTDGNGVNLDYLALVKER